MRAQMCLVTHAREHEQMRRSNRSGREDDLAGGMDLLAQSARRKRHAAGASAVEMNALGQAVRHDGQVRPADGWREVGEAGAATYAVPYRCLSDVNSFLSAAVVVSCVTQPVLSARF